VAFNSRDNLALKNKNPAATTTHASTSQAKRHRECGRDSLSELRKTNPSLVVLPGCAFSATDDRVITLLNVLVNRITHARRPRGAPTFDSRTTSRSGTTVRGEDKALVSVIS